VSKAVVITTGLGADGQREVLGLDVGDSENETFWREFLTGLNDGGTGRGAARRLRRPRRADQGDGPCFQGAAWQGRRAHVMRTVFARPDADIA
jgi:putative transposase